MDGNAPSTEETTKYPRMAFANARVWPDNPRKTIKGIDELAASISRNDIIEPLVVRALPAPEGDVTHEVLAGQRRYLAGQKAGLIDFPYILRQLDDAEALEIALVENNQREDPSPLEDAEALHKRMTDAKNPCTAEYLADRLGRPVKWVYGRLALRALCDEAKEWMRNGKLPLAHAQQLAAVDVDTQRRVLDRFKGAPELPAAKAFAHEITYALHLLSGAPFDCNDAKLPGGSCLKCTKRSDVQVELFDTGRDKGAHCLDNICWTNKVAAIWERTQRDAKKRHLEVLTDRDVVRDGYSEDRAHVEWGKPYDLKPQKEGDVPVAVARTPRGVVVELYAKTVKQGAGDDGGDDEFFEDEGDEDSDDANTERHAARDAERAAREAEHQGVATRVLALVRERHPAFARLALEIVEGSVYADRALPRLMRAVGVDPEPSGSDTRALVRLVPDADVVDVLITYAVLGCLTDPEPSDEAPEWEVRVRELVTGKPVVVPTTRVWIRAAEWDGLSDDTRENYEHGVDGREIGWEGREGFVTATVGNETLGYLQRISRSYKVTLHAEIEQPDPETQATEAPADEAPVVAPNLYSYGFAPGCPDEIKAEVQEIVGEKRSKKVEQPDAEGPSTPARERVLVVSDSGDWAGARRGLKAWDAVKTPGAGATSGGDCAPLVMLHTPATDSPDIATLLARYVKARRHVLDLGVIDRDALAAHDPSKLAIRERWNEAHPDAKVPIDREKHSS